MLQIDPPEKTRERQDYRKASFKRRSRLWPKEGDGFTAQPEGPTLMGTSLANRSPARASLLSGLQRLLRIAVEADRHHRERCKLADMPDHRLRDMGLPPRPWLPAPHGAQLRQDLTHFAPSLGGPSHG